MTKLEPLGYYHSAGDMVLNSTTDLDDLAWRTNQLRADADAYHSSQRHWIAALQGRVDLIPTDEIALNTMLIMEGIYLSHRLGCEVTAEEVKAESRSTAAKL